MVAANLAVLARADGIVQLSGPALIIAGAADLLVRVVAEAASRGIRRQVQTFRVTCWCPTPDTRDAASVAIDQTLAAVTFTTHRTDQARVIYFGTTVFDQSQDALLYRRDLLYRFEYATVLAAPQPAMLFGDLQLNAATFIA